MTRVQKIDGLESLQSIEEVSRNTIKIDDLESLLSIKEEVSRDTIKIDDLESLQSIEEMFITNPLEKKPSNFEKYNETMLWHVILRHASCSYLKKLQKVIKILEKVKFDDSMLECEVCIMAKMEKLPFKETRKRAERPSQVIHTDTILSNPLHIQDSRGLLQFLWTISQDLQ